MSTSEASGLTGTIEDVQHVVVIMQENRSFDHYFGAMPGVRGFGDRFPIPLESGKPVWFESDGTREIAPFHLDSTRMNAVKAPSTSHEGDSMQGAWNQGKYGLWPMFKVDELTKEVNGQSMGYYARPELPFQWALADAFTLCDNHFCSVLSATTPNRIQFFSGSNHDPQVRAENRHQTPETAEFAGGGLRPWVFGSWPDYKFSGEPFDWPTIPDVLEAAGVSWRIFQDPNDNFLGGMNGCLAFRSFREAQPGSPNYDNGMSLWSLDDFAAQVQDGTLPQVSWMLPSQAWSEHGMGSSTARGADYVHQILQAIWANPEVWARTLVVLTYDENDGYFDHVPPPVVPSFNLDGTRAGDSTLDVDGMYFDVTGLKPYLDPVFNAYFSAAGLPVPEEGLFASYIDERDTTSGPIRPLGMGFRVPLVVVSPWSRGGWVASEVFDHTSVAQFLEKRFGVTVPAIAPWNRAMAGDLTSCLDFTAHDPSVPQLPDTSGFEAVEVQQQAMPAPTPPETFAFGQPSGTRPSRPTPYALEVADGADDGRLTLTFASSGARGAVFHVYDRLHLDRIPRRYSVEAGKSLTDAAWDGGRYDLEVHGPNGFYRSVQGDGAAPTTARLELEGAHALRLTLRNATSEPVDAVVTFHAYEEREPARLRLDAHGDAELSWDASSSGNWYDVSVTTGGHTRRLAGRLENGGNLVSDPAFGAA